MENSAIHEPHQWLALKLKLEDDALHRADCAGFAWFSPRVTRIDQVFDFSVHRLRIQIQYFNERLLYLKIVQGVCQVPSCGCVDPRPPPSTHNDAFSLITRNERHRQKDPPRCARVEESDDSRFRLLGAVPDPTG
ncbi:hypothetical protein NPIL_363741 [Nephila pilipes]|uniref:Uncharacterized protein n=1 Tax=Nephila pilipes TaxID=299642 RepID=A0A8X6R2W2_NEPPI|nr:hypothetical protein NPIL_363741 [Nephila pilipes]